MTKLRPGMKATLQMRSESLLDTHGEKMAHGVSIGKIVHHGTQKVIRRNGDKWQREKSKLLIDALLNTSLRSAKVSGNPDWV
jgi:hypothetical protein